MIGFIEVEEEEYSLSKYITESGFDSSSFLADIGIQKLPKFDINTGEELKSIHDRIQAQILKLRRLKIENFRDLYLYSVLKFDQSALPQTSIYTSNAQTNYYINPLTSLSVQLKEILAMPEKMRDEYLTHISLKTSEGEAQPMTVEVLELIIRFGDNPESVRFALEKWGFDPQKLSRWQNKPIFNDTKVEDLLYMARIIVDKHIPLPPTSVTIQDESGYVNWDQPVEAIISDLGINLTKHPDYIRSDVEKIPEKDVLGRYEAKFGNLKEFGVRTVADLYLYLNLHYNSDLFEIKNLNPDANRTITDIVFLMATGNPHFTSQYINKLNFYSGTPTTSDALLSLLIDLGNEEKVRTKLLEFGLDLTTYQPERLDLNDRLIDHMATELKKDIEKAALGYNYAADSRISPSKKFGRGNEDSYGIRALYLGDRQESYGGLFIVSDGMGGLKNADKVSRQTVNLFIADMKVNLPIIMRDALIFSKDLRKLSEREIFDLQKCLEKYFNEAIPRINNLIVRSGLDGGATVTLVLRIGNFIAEVNIGDSPAYRVNENEREELTVKDSRASRRRPGLERTEYIKEEGTNMLVQYIGDPTGIHNIHMKFFVLNEGDKIVLCTDGFDKEVNKETLCRVVGKNSNPSVIVRELMRQAVENASDDYTLLVVGN